MSTPQFREWVFGGKRYRLVAFTRLESEYGYVGKYPHTYNVLQEKRRFLPGWKTVKEELVPSHALIEAGCFGATSWRSELHTLAQDAFGMPAVA